MSTAALLTIVATIVVNQPTPVHCNAPPNYKWSDGAALGWTYWEPGGSARVYLRECAPILRYQPLALHVFSHELLHVLHPRWSESQVWARQHSFLRRVLPVLRRTRAWLNC